MERIGMPSNYKMAFDLEETGLILGSLDEAIAANRKLAKAKNSPVHITVYADHHANVLAAFAERIREERDAP